MLSLLCAKIIMCRVGYVPSLLCAELSHNHILCREDFGRQATANKQNFTFGLKDKNTIYFQGLKSRNQLLFLRFWTGPIILKRKCSTSHWNNVKMTNIVIYDLYSQVSRASCLITKTNNK